MINKIKYFSSHPFIQSSLIVTLSSFIISFLNYIFNFFLGRLLGPTGYGEIAAFFSYTVILSFPLSVFTNIAIQKISSKDKNKLEYILSLNNWMIKKVKKYWLLLLFFVCLSPFVKGITNMSLISSYLLIPMIVLPIFSSFYNAVFQGLKSFTYISIMGILSTLIKLVGIIFLILGFNNINTVFVFLILASIIPFVINYYVINKKVLKNIKASFVINKKLLSLFFNKYFIFTGLSLFGVTLFSNIDIIIVKKFFSASDAGLYSAWSLFAKIVFYLTGPIISIGYVFFSEKKDIKSQKKIAIFSLIIISFTGCGCYFGYLLFPKFIINLIFGNKYFLISPYLKLAAFFGTFYSISMLINNYFLAKESRFSLIIPAIIPLYISGIFVFKQNIKDVMNTATFFSFFVFAVYMTAYIYKTAKVKMI